MGSKHANNDRALEIIKTGQIRKYSISDKFQKIENWAIAYLRKAMKWTNPFVHS